MLEAIYELLKRIAAALGVSVEPPPTSPPPPPPVVPPPPTVPPTVPPTSPPPPPSVPGLTPVLPLPAGPVRALNPRGQSFGVNWDQTAEYAAIFEEAGREFGIAPLLLHAFAGIESTWRHFRPDGSVVTGAGDARSIGIMQVRCDLHAANLPGSDCRSVRGNIRLAALLLSRWIRELGTWEAALTQRYHPGTDPVSGVSPTTYIRAVRDLIHEVKSQREPVTSPPPTVPPVTGNTYAVEGTTRTIVLPFPLRQAIIPVGQTNQRPGTRMTPDRYVQHDTGNRGVGANALMHKNYLWQGAPDNFGRPQQLSYHFTVDDKEAWQMIPVNEVAWHGGDGSGPCNMRGVSCELCINAGIDEPASRRNAEILAAELMNALGIESLKKHQDCSGKWCPQDMLNDGYWPTFVQDVSDYREKRRR